MLLLLSGTRRDDRGSSRCGLTSLCLYGCGWPQAARSGCRRPHPPPTVYGGVQHGPPGEGGASSYATPLRGPTSLPGRGKSGTRGTGIMTGETGPVTQQYCCVTGRAEYFYRARSDSGCIYNYRYGAGFVLHTVPLRFSIASCTASCKL